MKRFPPTSLLSLCASLLLGPSCIVFAQSPDLTLTNLAVTGTISTEAVNSTFFRMLPPGGNTNSGTFHFSSFSTANLFGEPRPNDVFRLSYNMSPSGGVENPADASFGYEFETHYAPSATERFFEHHLSYFSQATGMNYRPWTWTFFKSSTTPAYVDRIEHSIALDKFSILNRDYRNQYLIFQPNSNNPGAGGEVTLVGPTSLVALQNNYSPFIQLGPTGQSRSLIYLDNNSRIRLGASGDPVSLSDSLLWEQDGLFDIGRGAGSRPRDLYLARDARIGGSLSVFGNVGIGLNYPAFKLHVNGSVAGVGPYRNLSDERLKTNVVSVTGALDKVLSLRGVKFQWRSDLKGWEGMEEGTHLGFLAQEVSKILPEVVAADRQGTLNIAYGDILPVVVEAMKEQEARHRLSSDAKDRELQELRSRVQTLERLVDRVLDHRR